MNPPNQHEFNPNYTGPLRRFLWFAFQTTLEKDWVEINTTEAEVLAALDPLEQLIHVENPSPDNDLQNPRLWNVRAWRTCYERNKKTKERAEQDRAKRTYTRDLITRLAEAIVDNLGLENELALRMAKHKAKTEETLIKAMKAMLEGEQLNKDLIVYEP